LAIGAGAVATPLEFVDAAAVAEPLKLALAPELGAVNVTVTPLTGLPLAFVTVAWRAVAKAMFTVALCGVPAVAVMFAGVAPMFVKLKLAGVATPLIPAVTR
jgi:hypothetical protein